MDDFWDSPHTASPQGMNPIDDAIENPADNPYDENPADNPYDESPADNPFSPQGMNPIDDAIDNPADNPYDENPADNPYDENPADSPPSPQGMNPIDDAVDNPYDENPADNPYDAHPVDALVDNPADHSFVVEDAFASAVDAATEDEFLGRALKALRQAASPFVRRLAGRALPFAFNLLRRGLSSGGQAVGGWMGSAPGARLGARAGQWLGREARSQLQPQIAQWLARGGSMDAFADGAVLLTPSMDEMDEFVPVLAGIAARHVIRATLPAAVRQARPVETRQLGRAVARTVSRSARAVTRRFGPKAVRAVPAAVRQAVRVARAQQVAPRQIPRVVQRAVARLASSPRAVRRLSRPSPTARRAARQVIASSPRLRAQLGRRHACTCGGGHGRGRTLHLRGPVRISIGA